MDCLRDERTKGENDAKAAMGMMALMNVMQ